MAVSKDGGTSLPERVHDAPKGYENLTRIDQGGFAIVYRALDVRFDRTVALKILRSDDLNEHQLRRFNAECLATGRVSTHPNIVTVYDAGTTPGHRPWLAMEYCSGGSLARKVATQGPLPVAEVITIGARLSSALHAAHEAGILHRDVKPHNVLLTSYDEPALADFGIASVVSGDDTGGIVTETAAYTVVHAAPEILEGRVGTAAADIYSLGSTLYTLLAGQAPFAKEASTGLAPLITRILRNDLPVIARQGVPAELEQLLRWSMAALPQDRPTSAAELSASLAELGQRLQDTHRGSFRGSAPLPRTAVPGPAAPPANTPAPRPEAPAPPPGPEAPAPVPASPPISARRLLVMLGCALAVLLTAFTTWGLAHRGPDGDQRTPIPVTAKATQTDARYRPQNVLVAQGHNRGELIVSWTMPIRPDVVATVIYEEGDTAQARAIVNYTNSPPGGPQATLRGLPRGQQICLSAAHVVTIDDKTANVVSRPVCARPR